MDRPVRIVVGVDGSPAAHAAVRWASDRARELGAELALLHGIEPGRPTPFPAIPRQDAEDHELAPYTEALGDTGDLTISREVVDRAPSRALVDASDGALMVVLGRPRGRISSWPGPTSLTRRVLSASTCPVVLVPERLGASR